jgi:hypothetical protein
MRVEMRSGEFCNCRWSGWRSGILQFIAVALPITIILRILALLGSPEVRAQSNDAATVIQQGPYSYVNSPQWLMPTPGTPGFNAGKSNYIFYVLPGMGAGANPSDPQERSKPLIPFSIAYANNSQPLGTNKWWSQVGLQWSSTEKDVQTGFAFSWNDGLPRTLSFVDEPYYMQFVDFQAKGSGNPFGIDITGLRLVNMNSLYVNTSGRVLTIKDGKAALSDFSPSNVDNERGPIAEPQPVVTVGLEGVHPLGTSEATQPPWTNVLVQSYSDWGAVFSYTNSSNTMQITAASGSPYLWFERTSGINEFAVWAGSTEPGGTLNVWSNSGSILGITVTSDFLPSVPGEDLKKDDTIQPVLNTGDYVLYADQGSWTQTTVKGISMFVNPTATRVAVLALPHSVTNMNSNPARIAAADVSAGLGQYACRKITNTQIDYPPIAGSQLSTIIGGQTVPFGYFQSQGLVRYQLRVTTSPFDLPGCNSTGPALQMLMPHHVTELYPGQSSSIQSKYQWHGLVGPLTAFVGSSFVDQLSTLGTLSMFPAVLGNNSSLTNPLDTSGQLAIDDVYSTLTNWFYLEEGNLPKDAHLDSYARNLGTYDNAAANTYEQKYETLVDTALIADQLAQSPVLQNEKNNIDESTNEKTGACLCTPKSVVAEQIRNKVVQDLESLLAQWFDIYTAHLFQFIPEFNTMVGFPDGFGSVQDINDHHFHYGYYLRAAGLVGRYDPNWLASYQGAIDLLRQDVANFDRTNTNYPFLRNFDVYSGHSWATGDAGDGGENQESTSEAVNFEAGMIELAQLENNSDMLAVGELLYEQEISSAEDYWFNVNADFTQPVPPPPGSPDNVIYNGNWPQQWVTYNSPDKSTNPWHTPIGGIYRQSLFLRSTFFGGAASTYSIQNTPMSATGLWQARNQTWLNAAWKQYLLDAASEKLLNMTPDENIFAAIQARLAAGSDTSINGTGLQPALERIANPHIFAPYATDTMAKYWAYTNSLLGQIDPTVYADQPNFAVFVNGTGQQTFVAYNPGTTSLTFTFYKVSDNSEVTSFAVAAGAVVSQGAAGSTSFTPTADGPNGETALGPEPGRLYLQTAPSTSLPLTGTLTDDPGTWLPASETTAFPASNDFTAIMPSLTVVPVSTGNCPDIFTPGTPNSGKPCEESNLAYGKWVGSFSGTAIGQIPHTSFAVYADPALGAGWQTNPDTVGKNVTHVLVKYWFSQGNYPAQYPDRIEAYWNGTNASDNTFVIGANELTDYYFGCYRNFQKDGCDTSLMNPLYGLTTLGFLQVEIVNFKPGVGDLPIVPLPATVACGVVEVDVFGSAGPNQMLKTPLPVSTGTDPVMGRASWVRPPYNGGSCVSPADLLSATTEEESQRARH